MMVDYCDQVVLRVDRFKITFEDFKADRAMRDMLLMPTIQIGEISRSLSDECKKEYLEESIWRAIRGFRNTTVHCYDRIDLLIAWDTITEDVPKLEEELLAIPGVKESLNELQMAQVAEQESDGVSIDPLELSYCGSHRQPEQTADSRLTNDER